MVTKIIKKFNRRKIKIATLYISRPIDHFSAETMDTIRWLKISEALAHLGYQVDMITNEKNQKIVKMGKNLRRVPYREFDWKNYDVIKTLFQEGFASLEKTGGKNHPFIISKTTVVAKNNQPGIHFYGWVRWRLFSIQKRINQHARFITFLSKENLGVWQKEFHRTKNLLIIPTGVDLVIPAPNKNPYKKYSEKIVLFTGNIKKSQQGKVNRMWQQKLNALGKSLKNINIRLCFLGSGDQSLLDKKFVTNLSSVENKKIWDYLYYADCGIALAEGDPQNFESSKIYYYLRAGLPVVCESSIPNSSEILKAKLGYVVSFNDLDDFVEKIEKAVYKKWDKKRATLYMKQEHSWDQRVMIYDEIIQKNV
jgi:glycosyltransferase involved in cell wall biosynthesis